MSQPAPTYFVPRPATPPIYIAGASGDNLDAECAVSRCGDSVSLATNAFSIRFAPGAALNLARATARLAVECGYRDGDELARVAEYWRRLAIQCGWRDCEEDDGN